MRAKDAAVINRSVDFAESQFFGLAFQESSAVRTSESRNEPCILEFDQEASDNDWVGVHGLRQTRRRATVSFLQCKHGHHMYRKGKSATLHLVNVTAQITLSTRKAPPRNVGAVNGGSVPLARASPDHTVP